MKILFICYPHVGFNKTGMYYQIINTKKSLEKIGYRVDLFNMWSTKIEEYDICHFFSSHTHNIELFRIANKLRIPIVWSPVFNMFGKPAFYSKLQGKINEKFPFLFKGFNSLHEMLKLSSHVIFLNKEENYQFEYILGKDVLKKTLIPNGIDEKLFAVPKNPLNEVKLFTDNNPIVLNVGYFSERKNQKSLIQAAIKSNWNLCLVGKIDNSFYAKQCKDLAKGHENIKIVGELPYGSDELISYYKRAKVFALPSISEVQPLTIIEACINGCQIMVGENVPLQSFLKGKVEICEPMNISSIKESIVNSLENDYELADMVKQNLSWNSVAGEIDKVYLGLK